MSPLPSRIFAGAGRSVVSNFGLQSRGAEVVCNAKSAANALQIKSERLIEPVVRIHCSDVYFKEARVMIKRNLHNLDRLVRVVIGIGCVYVGFVDTSIISNNVVSMLVGAFGVVNIIAAAFSHCPIYNLAGLSTCPIKSGTRQE